jgi:hypothetical protein
MKRAILSMGFGALAVVSLAGICFLLPTPGVRLFVAPGELFADVFLPLTPRTLVTALTGDEGGPGEAIALFLLWSAAFWWLVFSVASFFATSRRKA